MLSSKYKKIIIYFARIFTFSLVGIILFHYGQDIDSKDRKDLIDALRNTSASIFSIMGIWIAVIYPQAFSKVMRSENIENEDQIERIKSLILPMLYSIIIFAFTLLIQFFNPIFIQIEFFIDHVKFFKGLIYSILGLLAILQIWSLFLCMIPAKYILGDLSRIRVKRNIYDAVRPKRKKVKK